MKYIFTFLCAISFLSAAHHQRTTPGVIFHDSTNYWDMNAGSLVTKKANLEQINSKYVYTTYTKGAVNQNSIIAAGQITIRLDDGYEDYYTTIAPLLQQYNAKAIAGIIASIPPKSNTDAFSNYLNWDEIRGLQNTYGWEICDHSYTHTNNFSDWNDVYTELVYSKTILESEGIHVNTYIAPYGYFDQKVDIALRRYYTAACATTEDYVKPENIDPYRLPTIPMPSDSTSIWDDIKMVADSGYWAIFYTHMGSPSTGQIEEICEAAEYYNVLIVTITEGLSRWNVPSNFDIMNVRLNTRPTRSLAGVNPLSMPINYAGENADFEQYSSTNAPLGWSLVTNSHNYGYTTLTGEPSRWVAGTHTFRAILDNGDTLRLSKTFTVPKMYAKMILFINPIQYSYGHWVVYDTVNNRYWDNASSTWSTSLVENVFTNVGFSTINKHVAFIDIPESTVVTVTFIARSSIDNMSFLYDDFSFQHSVDFTPETRIEFAPSHFTNYEVNSSVNFVFQNGVGVVLTAPNGCEYLLKIDNDGNLTTELISCP